ncbi:MAG: hypothetical protein R3C53_08405 [Pirellulaceae bacterium]
MIQPRVRVPQANRHAVASSFRPCHDGPLELKQVEEKFVRTATVMELVIEGQSIKTTAEHPFYVPARQTFVPAGELKPEIASVCSTEVVCTDIHDPVLTHQPRLRERVVQSVTIEFVTGPRTFAATKNYDKQVELERRPGASRNAASHEVAGDERTRVVACVLWLDDFRVVSTG